MEEDQGLLLRLPCSIGGEVWRIVNQRDNFTDQTYKIALRKNKNLGDDYGKILCRNKR